MSTRSNDYEIKRLQNKGPCNQLNAQEIECPNDKIIVPLYVPSFQVASICQLKEYPSWPSFPADMQSFQCKRLFVAGRVFPVTQFPHWQSSSADRFLQLTEFFRLPSSSADRFLKLTGFFSRQRLSAGRVYPLAQFPHWQNSQSSEFPSWQSSSADRFLQMTEFFRLQSSSDYRVL